VSGACAVIADIRTYQVRSPTRRVTQHGYLLHRAEYRRYNILLLLPTSLFGYSATASNLQTSIFQTMTATPPPNSHLTPLYLSSPHTLMPRSARSQFNSSALVPRKKPGATGTCKETCEVALVVVVRTLRPLSNAATNRNKRL